MESKSPTEMSARRRRNHGVVNAEQQQQQQQQPAAQQQRRKAAAQQERAAGSQQNSRSKAAAAAKQSPAPSKPWVNPMSIAIVPPSRQASSSNNNSNNNNNKTNGKVKKQNRSASAREPHRDVQRAPVTPPATTSRVAFGRSCPSAASTMTMTPATTNTVTRRVSGGSSGGGGGGGGGSGSGSSSNGNQKCRQDTPRPKPMQVAHDQLELLLTRIEQDTAMPPPRRRKPPPTKTVRRQMEHPPPVPTVTPLGSARGKDLSRTPRPSDIVNKSEAAGSHALPPEGVVPLTQNPRLLAPEQRQALLELLSRSEPQDQEIVNALRTEITNAGDPSSDAMRLTLQMLPLALTPGNSPYCERFWEGHRYLKERQRLHQQLQPDDLRYKEVKILRSANGKFFLSKTLEEELKDEKHVLDYIESELQRSQLPSMPPAQRARQRQALDERVELDRQKQQVSDWREEQRIADQKRAEHQQVTKRMLNKAKLIKRNKHQQQHLRMDQPLGLDLNLDLDLDLPKSEEEDLGAIQQADDDSDYNEDADQADNGDNEEDSDATPRPSVNMGPIQELETDLVDTREQRRQFQNQCQSSSLYGDSNCLTPWTLYSNISNNLVEQMTRNIDAELHRSIAGFIKDFVDNETRTTNNQTN